MSDRRQVWGLDPGLVCEGAQGSGSVLSDGAALTDSPDAKTSLHRRARGTQVLGQGVSSAAPRHPRSGLAPVAISVEDISHEEGLCLWRPSVPVWIDWGQASSLVPLSSGQKPTEGFVLMASDLLSVVTELPDFEL